MKLILISDENQRVTVACDPQSSSDAAILEAIRDAVDEARRLDD